MGLVARANFPGIVAQPGAAVSGLLLKGISRSELVALDRYEGELYRRIRVGVVPEGAPTALTCWVYVIAAWAETRVTNTPWTIQWYRQQGSKGRLTYRN